MEKRRGELEALRAQEEDKIKEALERAYKQTRVRMFLTTLVNSKSKVFTSYCG
jgi:hypothetical protein